MITVRISETEQAGLANLSFDHGHEYPVQISEPFSEPQEQRLEWYYEQYIRQPFSRLGEEQQAASSLRECGEKLFNQIFSAREAYADYRSLVPGDFRFEIAGSPNFHAIH